MSDDETSGDEGKRQWGRFNGESTSNASMTKRPEQRTKVFEKDQKKNDFRQNEVEHGRQQQYGPNLSQIQVTGHGSKPTAGRRPLLDAPPRHLQPTRPYQYHRSPQFKRPNMLPGSLYRQSIHSYHRLPRYPQPRYSRPNMGPAPPFNFWPHSGTHDGRFRPSFPHQFCNGTNIVPHLCWNPLCTHEAPKSSDTGPMQGTLQETDQQRTIPHTQTTENVSERQVKSGRSLTETILDEELENRLEEQKNLRERIRILKELNRQKDTFRKKVTLMRTLGNLGLFSDDNTDREGRSDRNHPYLCQTQCRSKGKEAVNENSTTKRTVVVRNLPQTLCRRDLSCIFEIYGKVLECDIACRHYAYLLFEQAEAAEEAAAGLDRQNFKDSRLDVQILAEVVERLGTGEVDYRPSCCPENPSTGTERRLPKRQRLPFGSSSSEHGTQPRLPQWH